ncbi:hypothetical protein BGZ94_007394 [Podila epigama]|nr:hypothetical protein BGZ94_007394 [Podila epigama]
MTRRPLQVVCFPKAEIALETIFVLKYHFAHLHEIDIRFCRRVPSTTVRDILTFCPKLQKLAAFSLHARDIIKSLPWVCHRMRELAISINLLVVADIPEAIDKKQQRYIYQRISQLTELRSLDLGLPVDVSTNQEGFGAANIGEITVGFPHREMRPSVEYGLEHLGSLSKLQNLRLPCYRAARGVDIDFVQWALPNAKIF